jgi:histidine ammonia-lyase
LITAAEGIEYRAPLLPGRGVKLAYDLVRSLVPRLQRDRSMTSDIEKVVEAIHGGEFDQLVA